MSGGSFNYLCHADPSELFNKRSDLSDMVEALASMGHKDASTETEGIKLILDHFESLMQARLNRLAPVWKAVEWKRSGDWGQDQVDDELAKYRKDVLPSHLA